MQHNPATVGALVRLMLGGLHLGYRGGLLHCRVRYFDPKRRRAGLPDGVAALVERMGPEEVTVNLVNLDPVRPRELVVQMGAYAEHECTSLVVGGEELSVEAPFFTVRLAPGSGGRLVITQRRYANRPTLAHPWNRVAQGE